uniref:Uncharacterized protein n=1 Tax=Leersia perrieri TaxID=77586 RepID=A0A0D9WUA4_9ORYZ
MAPTTTIVPASPGRRKPFTGGGHVRSASVPCHSHPLLTHVDDQLLALRSWTSNPADNPLSLAHVRALLCLLDELLHLPAAILLAAGDASSSTTTETLLHGFLVLADAFGTFLSSLLALRSHAADLHAAVRRRDIPKIASAARAHRHLAKDIAHLAAAVSRDAAACRCATTTAEIRTVAEAINDTAVASASVFMEVASLVDAAAAAASPAPATTKKRLVPAPLRSKKVQLLASSGDEMREAVALQKLKELEQCIEEVESESEKVFRSLVQARVSLLNIHTPTF